MKKRIELALSTLFAIYCLSMYAIISPMLSSLSNNQNYSSVGLSFVFLFALVAWALSQPFSVEWKGIFSSLDESDVPKWWARLHMLFSYVTSSVFIGTAIFSVIVPFYLHAYDQSLPTVIMLTGVTLFLSIIGLWHTHLIVGMGYKWFCKGTSLGIQSLSALGYEAFEKKDSRGIEYLLDALRMFQEYLRRQQLENEELNKAIGIMGCFNIFKSEIPYETLQALSLVMERFPSVESLPGALSTFNSSKEVEALTTFKAVQKTGRPPIEWILVIASVLAALTFVPESTRTVALGYLQSILSVASIQISVGIFFFASAAIVGSLDADLRISPVAKYLESRRIRKESLKK
jgi:hypothetical protein